MFGLLYQIPTALQRLYRGVVWRMSAAEKKVYLTFDDGCVPEVTPKVLDILAHYGVHATFFFVGDNIRKYPELFKTVAAAGHAVGNHTFHHLKGWRSSNEDYIRDVVLADEYINNNLPEGVSNPHLFRPPYGRFSPLKKRAISKEHKIVLWDVLTHDYNACYTPEKIVRIVKRYVRNGSIIVFHDSIKAEKQMLPALPQVIEYLLNQGYEFDTLDRTLE